MLYDHYDEPRRRRGRSKAAVADVANAGGGVRVFCQKIAVFINESLSASAQSAHLATVARTGLAELLSTNRGSPKYYRIVDGVVEASEDNVRPDGQIIYRFNHYDQVLEFALSWLRAASPKVTGRFARSFYVGVNGVYYPPHLVRAARTLAGCEIVIGNTQPDARKVDSQLVGDCLLNYSVPPNLFARAAAAVNAAYGDIVKAKSVYSMNFPDQYLLKQTQWERGSPHRWHRSAGTPVESPAIIILPRDMPS